MYLRPCPGVHDGLGLGVSEWRESKVLAEVLALWLKLLKTEIGSENDLPVTQEVASSSLVGPACLF